MEIAPDFTDVQWKQLALTSERDWIRAIAVLRRRITERFLRPARALLRLRWSGFAVLGLDSLLIETLQQFLEGVPETPRVVRGSRRVLASQDYFKAFLTGAYFGPGFVDETATLFYTTIRCGILHQAEVKESSLVRRDRPLVTLTQDRKGIVINPVLLHGKLEQAFTRYLKDLREPSNTELRQRFRAKMDHIARVGRTV